jgi:hypothetical protein
MGAFANLIMAVITQEFVDGIIRSGPLTEARVRMESGLARPRNKAHWNKFTSWALICEEIVDTEHESDGYDDITAELQRRGFDFEQIDAMRRFAWKTVGWLNYDKMMWEWGRLDEKDIAMALEWQFKDGVITREQFDKGRGFIEQLGKTPK